MYLHVNDLFYRKKKQSKILIIKNKKWQHQKRRKNKQNFNESEISGNLPHKLAVAQPQFRVDSQTKNNVQLYIRTKNGKSVVRFKKRRRKNRKTNDTNLKKSLRLYFVVCMVSWKLEKTSTTTTKKIVYKSKDLSDKLELGLASERVRKFQTQFVQVC